MKGRFKYSPNLTLGSMRSSCTTRVEIVSPPKIAIANQLLTLRIRLSHALLTVPFVMSGIGYLPQAAQAQIIDRDGNGCPAGTRIGTTNFIVNGNFATNAGTGLGVATGPAPVPPILRFTSDLPYRGDGLYPDDGAGGGLSIQSGSVDYTANFVAGRPFPGDPANGVPASNTYLYSNPNVRADGTSAITPGNPIIWSQTVTGLQPNTTYNFIAYFYNLLTVPGASPIIVLRIGSSTGSSISGAPITVSTRQQWIPVQFAFTTEAGQNSTTLTIIDQANDIAGDDFGLTAIALNKCEPLSSNGGLTLVKRITSATRGGVPISGLSFSDVIADTDASAINQAGLRPVGLTSIPDTNPLQSGDDVQYTIYFLGQQALENFNLCDLIPTGTSYVPNSISIAGSGAGADQGRYFSPLTSLEQVAESNVCENRRNPNGTVIVKLGNVPSGQPGSVSLRVKIN
ncbi:hypothetical protein [Calothrix sp. PCC 7507]|uniref:hypothetical protein n=1 Tax=Calothrix sp. PCC 7507 TaxID=99598 RepID=UPI00029F3100|nr:hypothetical protein [Calothrix sp. PCC 7507]AFY31096.1 hypothetical protein Cal7507_0606 [Calothrix sp. PCC 7507]